MNLLTPELLAVLLGQLVPYAIDVINRYIPNSRLRFLVSVLYCLGVGVIISYEQLNFVTIESTLDTGVIVFTSAKFAYEMYYKQSQVHHKLRNPN